MSSARKSFFLFLIFVLFDHFFWEVLFWKIPNEASWGTDFFYNYVYEKKRLEAGRGTKERILVLGSSVARYSFDNSVFEAYLETKGIKKEVRLLSHAGLTPMDAYAQRDSIEKMQPSLLVYPLNFVDFRIFRAFQLVPQKKLEEVDEDILISDSLQPSIAPQVISAYPWEALRDFSPYFSLDARASFLSAGIFSFYRYREFGFDNFKYMYAHRNSRNTRYYWYQGIQIPERVSTLGWTKKSFSFEIRPYMKEKGFWVQVVPEILQEGPLVINIKSDRGDMEEFILKDVGWQQIVIQKIGEGDKVRAELSATWKPIHALGDRFDYAREDMGVRLQETFGLDTPHKNFHVVREERSEDDRFVTLTEREYEDYFHFRLLQDLDSRPGLVAMQLYKDSKERLHREVFRPFYQYRFLKLFTEEMRKRKIPTLLILNPENPYSLVWYKDSQYLKDEIRFLESLEGEGVQFLNLHSYLDGKNFSDYHHLTYQGMLKMTPVYAEKVIQMTAK
jgi:hypothetical protein